MEILLREKLFFAGFAERPTEVPAQPCKKVFGTKDYNVKLEIATNKKYVKT